MRFLSRYLLEPASALTHLVGAVASAAGLVILLKATWGDKPKMLSMLVYGLSMVLLYLASTLLHGVRTTPANRMWLNRLDHAAIFLLIAGTYTPIAYNLFPDPWRWIALGVVWLAVLLGIGYKLKSAAIHGFFNASVYVIFGWGSALPLFLVANLFPLVPARGLILLLIGGAIYTGGFVIYYFKKPDPWPNVFGHHEIWHLLVLGGSLCHFFFMLYYVVPVERSAL